MHGLKPDDIKHLLHLRGMQLIQVAVGQYQLQFHFHPPGNVSVEGRCELIDNSGTVIDTWDRGAI